MDIPSVFKNNEDWIAKKLEKDSDYFKNLAKGQNPDILYIGCSDSRVTAEDLMGVEPGDVFVHRNIANMVISIDLNAMSVLTYAVDYLKVDHVVICGHYQCGGVKAAMNSADLGILNPWLRNIRDVYRIHRNELKGIEGESEKYDRLVELNVQEQCVNLLKTAVVQKAVRNRGMKIHGWVFDVGTGKLIDLKIDFNAALKEITEIYDLGGMNIDSLTIDD
ncbi:carbonic anhydrase [Aquiflexum balticum DSM 16537]|uniref:Carbonic anhydrase 2 n=1 Tax=Aquiflexum balticum DSM 16537 TaxID=758820 RepID=A0A1W2H4D5_9BACT|nr:carbonic anhydrase [Aquiflexum balticum]SMD43634.1 carbonic anhydrase [Aquiflexum balticum DSM 16537]